MKKKRRRPDFDDPNVGNADAVMGERNGLKMGT